MPWSPPIPFRPGVNTVMTPVLNGSGWSNSNLMRFRDGIPEKNGGWARLADQTLIGTARGMNVWSDLSSLPYAMFGTEQRLQLLSIDGIEDVTPIALTNDLTPAFVTTLGNTSVQITDASAPAAIAVGDWIVVNVPIAVGGIVIQGMYQVASVTTPGSVYTITIASAALSNDAGGVVPHYSSTATSSIIKVTLTNHGYATSDTYVNEVQTSLATVSLGGFTSWEVSNVIDANNFQFDYGIVTSHTTAADENGGDAQLQYCIPTGFANADLLTGFGVGLFGSGFYGRSGSGVAYTTIRQWFMDHWGQDWVGNYPGSPIFVWVPPWAIGNRALAIDGTNFPSSTSPPQKVNVCFVTMPVQILMALGCEPSGGGTQDPNLIRWSNLDDFTDWVASAVNQAGSYRIPTGSRLIGGIAGPTFGLVCTDEDVYIFNYIGFPLVFGFNRVSGGTGLLAGRCIGTAGGLIYWVAPDGIYKFDGSSASIVPCPVWDTMFRDLDKTQIDKCHMAVNSRFNEFAIFFPSLSGGSGEIDCYIRLNYRENLWDIGAIGTLLSSTCWHDENDLGPPIAVDLNKLIQQHEIARDADGAQMLEFITSGYFSIDNGWLFTIINQVVSDMKYEGTNAQLTFWILTKQYPKDDPTTYGPFTDTPTLPEFETINARGRMAAIKLGYSSIGSWWRLGWFRYLYAPDGSL